MKDISQRALEIVKNQAKSMGLTQSQFAQRLNVSLPTLKRWYGGGTITLESLHKLCNEVGISLSEVFSSVENITSQTFQYTLEQESFLAAHLDCLAYFDNLLRGMTASQIEKKFNLPERKTIQFLSKLAKLKLIEWLPKNQVRLLVQGEPVWRQNGPLGSKLRNIILENFLTDGKPDGTHFFLHDYLEEDRDELDRKIHEVLKFAQRANNRAKFHTTKAKPAALYISLQNFRWNIDKYLMKEQ